MMTMKTILKMMKVLSGDNYNDTHRFLDDYQQSWDAGQEHCKDWGAGQLYFVFCAFVLRYFCVFVLWYFRVFVIWYFCVFVLCFFCAYVLWYFCLFVLW